MSVSKFCSSFGHFGIFVVAAQTDSVDGDFAIVFIVASLAVQSILGKPSKSRTAPIEC
jgi:hypothetical protein